MSDLDGDILLTTDQKEFIDGAQGGVPITYHRNKFPKEKIVEDYLYEYDMKAFYAKIGFITNCSTTMYAMLPLFEKDSKEYTELINRLKTCRKLQGIEIDKAKGLFAKPFPKHWTKWIKIDEDMSDEEKKLAKFNNSIVIDKRPYFMRWLYPHYNKEFVQYNLNYHNYSIANYRSSLVDLLQMEEPTEKQQELISKYYKFNPLLDSECVMNRLCHHMESEIKELKVSLKHKITDENIYILKNHAIELDKVKLKKLYDLYKKYKSEKRNFATIKDENGEEKYKTIEQYNKYVKHLAYNISSDISELANLAVTICYEIHPNDNKYFAWTVFGDGIIENVKINKQDKCFVPFADNNGDIDFLNSKYKVYEIEIDNVEWNEMDYADI